MSMTTGNDYQTLPVSTVGQASDQRCNNITYTREFLLSFSELEICKQPPRGFDPSIINESQEVVPSAPEWRRSIGSSSAQNPKRSDNGLAAWVENANNAARGSYDKTSHSHGSSLIHGKWDSRSVSSVSSDNDGDQHSDRGSENNRYGGQPRRSWQPPEHDGLLGSGGFPRPSVHAGGPLSRGNSQYHPNRSSEPYQPPRAFKPSVHPRRDPTDICNDETFGSLECSSEEKTEEEKRRKESFELMRKEQLKELQERQNQRQQLEQNIDISESLENMDDDKVQSQSSKADDCDLILSQNDCAKSSLPQSSSRPSVPPGFRNGTLDKSSNPKAPISLVVSESMETIVHDDAFGTGGSFLLDDPVDGQVKKHAVLLSNSGTTSSEVANLATDGAKKPISALSASCELIDQIVHNGNSRIMDTEEEINSKMQGSVTPEPSILDKLFGSAMSVGTGLPSSSEPPVDKPEEERWHPVNHSSKFATWFIEEEKKSTLEVTESKAGDLLSLLVNNEKPSPPHVSEFSEKEVYGGGSLFPLDGHKSLQTASVHFQKKDVQDEKSRVLTCEDLEQSIIAEANSGQSSAEIRLHDLLDIRGGARNVDNNASSHILSLLQKRNGELDVSPQRFNLELLLDEQTGPVEVVRHPEKTLTLEALFGSAFMEELQSVEAPVSAQRGPVGGVVRTASGSVAPNLLPDVASTAPIGYSDSFFGKSSGSESLGEVINGNVTGFDDSKYATTSMVANGVGLEDVRIEHAPSDIQLPEEDSLIMVSGQRTMEDLRFASPPRVVRNVDTFVESTPTFDFVDKIAILNLGNKEHRPGMHGLSRHPSQDDGRISLLALEAELHKQQQQQHMFNGQQPSVHHFHMNQPRPPPPFVHLEQDMIRNQQQLRLMRPENAGFDPRHQFPAEMLHHSFNQNIGPGARFDGVPHPMLQNMIPNNFPGTHSGMPLPGGAPFPSHRSGVGAYDNRMPPFMPEQNQIHGLHLQPRPLNYNRMGMPMQGIGPMGVGAHAELERLMEMELRANANKKHPVANNPALYGPEVDMGFRYR